MANIPGHLKEARKKLTLLAKKSKKKLLDDEDRCVLIVHSNRTIQLFNNALLHYEYIQDNGYIFVLTKYQGNFVFPLTKLIYFTKFRWEPVEFEALEDSFQFDED
jgi:hypothetical protein